jgi:hypothetical protein
MYSIVVSSSDRISGVSSTDFEVRLPQTFSEITEASLDFCVVPAATYVIESSFNQLPILEGSTNKTATIPPGDYSGFSLANALQNALNSVGSGYTCQFDQQTYKLTINGTVSFSLLFFQNPRLGKILGFGIYNTAIRLSHTGENAVSLLQPLIACISIEQLDTTIYTSKRTLNSSFVIQLEEGTGKLNTYRPLFPSIKTTRERTFGSMQVKLTDLDGVPLNLQELDWSFGITLYSKTKK